MPQLAETGRAGTPREHSITFDHVSFSYDQRPILRDVSFAIPDRTTTAIVGPSGSGKTTLCNLIARFWDVESGTVLVGGQNVKDYTLEDLMDQISMVFQKVYLFADTVENNIKFGCPNATHEEWWLRRRKPVATTSFSPCPKAMTPSSARVVPVFPAASASASPLLGLS